MPSKSAILGAKTEIPSTVFVKSSRDFVRIHTGFAKGTEIPNIVH